MGELPTSSESYLGAEKLADMQGRLMMSSQQLQQRTQMKTHEAVTSMHVDMIRALHDVSTSSAKEHETKRLSIKSLEQEAEKQAAQLRGEIRTLRLELEKLIAESVIKSEGVSKAEQHRLHEFTNATYKLWAAKEVMLSTIMVRCSIALQAGRTQQESGDCRRFANRC